MQWAEIYISAYSASGPTHVCYDKALTAISVWADTSEFLRGLVMQWVDILPICTICISAHLYHVMIKAEWQK